MTSILDQLELSVRAQNVLRARGGVDTLSDFMALNRSDVLRQPKAGQVTWREIERMQTYLRSEPDETPTAPTAPTDAITALRDAAALAALQGFCAQADSSGTWSWLPDMAAAEAWRVADAFIAARETKGDAG
jgi:hypothetical protein